MHDHLQTGQGRNYTDAERFAQVAGLGFLYGTKRNQEELTIGDNNELISTKVGDYWSNNDVIKDREESEQEVTYVIRFRHLYAEFRSTFVLLRDRKSTRLNSSHPIPSRMPSSA